MFSESSLSRSFLSNAPTQVKSISMSSISFDRKNNKITIIYLLNFLKARLMSGRIFVTKDQNCLKTVSLIE